MNSRNFIEREVFDNVMRKVRRLDTTDFRDVDTVYGDMSRLVVAWLACTPPDRLRALYNELGWKGSANARAIHEAAKAWLTQHHPGRCPVVGADAAK
jgi:hypothetical protein